jgi:DNA-binding MarR family transcriptional regulator
MYQGYYVDHPTELVRSSDVGTGSTMTAVTDDCAGHPLAVLLELADRLRAHLEHAARSVGLTPHQAQLLMGLGRPTRMSELAELRLCDPSSITSMVHRLERDGFVTREIDPTDGRARRIRLTPKGRRARQRFQTLVGSGADLVAELPPEHRAALVALFGAGPTAGEPRGGLRPLGEGSQWSA